MKKKRKVGRPPGTKKKTGATPKLWHPSEEKSKVAKSRKKDERGYFLGKRQLRFDINYVPEEQNYYLTATSGNGEVDQKERSSSMEGIRNFIERIFTNWRANLQ